MKLRIKRKGKRPEIITVKNRGTMIQFTEGHVTIYQPDEEPILKAFDIAYDRMGNIPLK